VESCSALVETMDGTLSLLVWNDKPHVLRQFVPSQWAELNGATSATINPSGMEIYDAIGERV